jgi:hypothetical protein
MENENFKNIDGVWENFNSNLVKILEFNNFENELNWSGEDIEKIKNEIINFLDNKINEKNKIKLEKVFNKRVNKRLV